MKGLVLLMRQH